MLENPALDLVQMQQNSAPWLTVAMDSTDNGHLHTWQPEDTEHLLTVGIYLLGKRAETAYIFIERKSSVIIRIYSL